MLSIFRLEVAQARIAHAPSRRVQAARADRRATEEAQMKHLFWRILNALQGCGYSWRDPDGYGKTICTWRGTCPRPLRNDWSARACIKAGDCGCDEQSKRGAA